MKRVGFIGLGNMGFPMAANLLKAGIDVNAYDYLRKARGGKIRDGLKIAQIMCIREYRCINYHAT